MTRIDFTPKCRQCSREIKPEEVLSPCPQCGFDSLKEGQETAEKILEDIQKHQQEHEIRVKDPDYKGPRFDSSLKGKQRLPRSILRNNQIDQAEALSCVIREKDPKLKNAFTPEVAENLLGKGG